MMTSPDPTKTLSILERAKVVWAAARYDFWLDLNSVPGRQRKELTSELKANLYDAAADVGLQTALANVGSLRVLAGETTRDGRLRSRWMAGWVTALSVLALLFVAFVVLTLYYTEGVLDAGATEPVHTSLFPFLWSEVTVDPSAGGLAWSMQPGPIPLLAAITAWLVVTRPWRSLGGNSGESSRF